MTHVVCWLASAIAVASTGEASAQEQPTEEGQPEPSAGKAADLGPDEVHLKNGGVLRGTVLQYEPGERVVIQVYGSDTPRTISWVDIADVIRGKYAPEPKPTEEPEPEDKAPSGKQTREDAEDVRQGVVRIHVESPDPNVEVHEFVTVGTAVVGNTFITAYTKRVVCTGKCGESVEVNRGQRFYVDGPDMRPSNDFTLEGKSGDVTLSVDPGSPALFAGGVALAAGGGAMILGGVIWTMFGFGFGAFDEYIEEDALKAGGVTVLVAGVLALGGSVPLIVLSRTGVELREGKPNDTGWLGRGALVAW